MTFSDRPSRFELVADELRALGITVRSLPGEYCVNFRDGSEATVQIVEDLDQALEVGRAMAAARPAPPARFPRRRRRRATKSRRGRKVRRRIHRLSAQTFRKPPDEG